VTWPHFGGVKNTGYFVRSMKIIIKFVDMYLINEANY
jgi:hypothetical protein